MMEGNLPMGKMIAGQEEQMVPQLCLLPFALAAITKETEECQCCIDSSGVSSR